MVLQLSVRTGKHIATVRPVGGGRARETGGAETNADNQTGDIAFRKCCVFLNKPQHIRRVIQVHRGENRFKNGIEFQRWCPELVDV